MIRFQIQLPDELYRKLKAICAAKEWTMAETLRRGAELVTSIYQFAEPASSNLPPKPLKLGDFQSDYRDWRESSAELIVAEEVDAYGAQNSAKRISVKRKSRRKG